MKESVKKLLAKQRARNQPEQPALSVFTAPDLDAAAICGRAPILSSWSKIRVSTVGKLRERGFDVAPPESEDGHTSVKLPEKPSDDDYERFLEAFGPAETNPLRLE